MAAYRRVYDSRHLQADCQGPGSAPEPYALQSSMGTINFFYSPIMTAQHRMLQHYTYKKHETQTNTQLERLIKIKNVSANYVAEKSTNTFCLITAALLL